MIVEACQTMVRPTWLRTKPSARKIARSRRRRRTDVTSVCTSVPAATSASKPAPMLGRFEIPSRLARSLVSERLTTKEWGANAWIRAEPWSSETPGAKRMKALLSITDSERPLLMMNLSLTTATFPLPVWVKKNTGVATLPTMRSGEGLPTGESLLGSRSCTLMVLPIAV